MKHLKRGHKNQQYLHPEGIEFTAQAKHMKVRKHLIPSHPEENVFPAR